jgi:hypothetical protein
MFVINFDLSDVVLLVAILSAPSILFIIYIFYQMEWTRNRKNKS